MRNRGYAMPMVIAATLIVSITAAIVMNLTFQRYRMSALRSSRAQAIAAGEAGLQFIYARLQGGFEGQVRQHLAGNNPDLDPDASGTQSGTDDGEYVMAPLPNPPYPLNFLKPPGSPVGGFTVDVTDDSLRIGKKLILIVVDPVNAADDPLSSGTKLKIRTFTEYGSVAEGF